MTITPNLRFDHYEIIGPLGAGGMGEVYHARDTRLNREVAIKVMARAASDKARGRKALGRFIGETSIFGASRMSCESRPDCPRLLRGAQGYQ